MTTLEKQIKKILDNHDIIYTTDYIKSVAEYMDIRNSEIEDDEIYTPEKWFRDTMENCPDQLVRRTELVNDIVKELFHMQKECLDQTGTLPSLFDYSVYGESDEYKELSYRLITLDEVFNEMIRRLYAGI